MKISLFHKQNYIESFVKGIEDGVYFIQLRSKNLTKLLVVEMFRLNFREQV